jgi:hypothetical protein
MKMTLKRNSLSRMEVIVERRLRMDEQIEGVGKKIEKWLTDEEFQISKVTDENAYFSYKVTKGWRYGPVGSSTSKQD